MANVFGSSEGAIQWELCQGWSLKESLLETVMVRMYVDKEGQQIQLTASKETLAPVLCLKDWNDDSKLALALLTLKDFNVTYCNSTKMVLKMGYLGEDILLDKEEEGEIDQDDDGCDKPGDQDADHHNSDRSDEDKAEECDDEVNSHRGEATL